MAHARPEFIAHNGHSLKVCVWPANETSVEQYKALEDISHEWENRATRRPIMDIHEKKTFPGVHRIPLLPSISQYGIARKMKPRPATAVSACSTRYEYVHFFVVGGEPRFPTRKEHELFSRVRASEENGVENVLVDGTYPLYPTTIRSLRSIHRRKRPLAGGCAPSYARTFDAKGKYDAAALIQDMRACQQKQEVAEGEAVDEERATAERGRVLAAALTPPDVGGKTPARQVRAILSALGMEEDEPLQDAAATREKARQAFGAAHEKRNSARKRLFQEMSEPQKQTFKDLMKLQRIVTCHEFGVRFASFF